MQGLNNAKLRELGAQLEFCDGVIEFFESLRKLVDDMAKERNVDITLEHYIISTGLAEMIRGSKVAPYVDGIFGCEFVEEPLPPYFSKQGEFDLSELSTQINQIGMIVDNTIKTRFIFEINKGTNKNPAIDVNAPISIYDRRVPIRNMIYIADGLTDVPCMRLVKEYGGKSIAVYNPSSAKAGMTADRLIREKRADFMSAADYREGKDMEVLVRLILDHMAADTRLQQLEGKYR